MRKLIDALAAVLLRDEQACVVTVSNVRGSAPRDAGTKMLVTRSSTVGTIGGGQLEYQCTRIAADRIGAGVMRGDSFSRRFPLGSNCGQCCGGVVDVSFEPVTAERVRALRDAFELHQRQQDFVVALFGAGHVGSALVATLAALDCQVRWIDSRPGIFPQSLPSNVIATRSESPAAEVAAMPAATFYLIMTHSHSLDLDICDQVLRRGDAVYTGLIGSLSKRRRFERLLRKQGSTNEMLAQLHCPIGVSGIPGKQPQEIAIAVAAELLQIRASVAGTTTNQIEKARSKVVHAL